jgi:cell wall-associated NlpC family hydrolase
MPLTPAQREQVVRAAKEWMGTPYHHQARVKGAGADCAMCPLAVYQECGILPADFQPPEYSMQWHLHRSEEMYLQTIEPFVHELPCSFCGESEDWPIHLPGEGHPYMAPMPQPADFVVFKFGRTFSHGAIVIAWPLIIHSYIPHGVTLADALIDGQLIGREMKAFQIK